MQDMDKDIQLDLVLLDIKATNRKHALQILSQEICAFVPCYASNLCESLIRAEQGGSSGIGDGVAIPHVRMKNLHRPFTALARLSKPIKFEAIDNRPVDLVYCLVSPETDGPYHLRRLSRITRAMKNHSLCEMLRETDDVEAVRSMFVDKDGWMMAA